MSYNVYFAGALVRSVATFLNAAGAPTNPTTTTFKYRAASGSIQTPGPVNDSPGIFHCDIDTTGWAGPGLELYTCEWIGTGAVQAPGIDYFNVEALPL